MNEGQPEEKDAVKVYTPYGYARVKVDILKKIEEANKKDNDENIAKVQDEAVTAPPNEDRMIETRRTNSKEATPPKEEKIDSVPVEFVYGAKGFVNAISLRPRITVRVKTFYGARKTFEFEVNITEKIGVLFDKIAQDESEGKELLKFHDKRLISPCGTIKNLNTESTFFDSKISNNSLFLLIGERSFKWDSQYKGTNITLLNDSLVANKKYEIDYETVFANIGFDSGRHYWEIKLDMFVDVEDIMVGVAQKNMNLYMRPLESNKFWGYICLGSKKFAPANPGNPPVYVQYGVMSQLGDVIGVLLEFKEGEGSLTFYRNGQNMGKAFSNMAPGTYYPAVCLYYGEVQVTLNPCAPIPKS